MGITTLQLNSRCMNTHLLTSLHLAPPYNILTTDTRDDTFNNNKTIQLGTSPLLFAAAPRHSYDHDMHFPWPYAHTTPPPLPTTQPQPTWPMPQTSTAPTFPSTQPSAYPHPQPQPFQPPPLLSTPTATALTYGTPSTWTFVQPCHVPPQPTHPTPVFPTAAPPPSYLLPPPQPTPPAELPPPTTLTHPPPTQQQTAIANYPSTDPQCAIPQGVWQPYSAFPPVTQPPLQPLPPPPPPQTITASTPTQPPPQQQLPSDPTPPIQPIPTTAQDNPLPVQNTPPPATVSQHSASPSLVSATPAPGTSLPAPDKPDTTASPAPQPPSPQPPHSSRRHHHKSRRKSDHHHRGRHRHRRRHRHHHHSKHHSTTRRRRSPSTSTYTSSLTPSRSRSPPPPIDLRPNTEHTNPDPSQYPTTAVLRRPINRWRPPPNFHTFTPADQILEWLEFHATQLDNPNRPQHQYIANILTDCNITYKEITDFRQYTHAKWNDTTHQYDQFQYYAISLPFLNTKATTPEPPAVSRATSTHREVAHINAGHTGPVGNISNILRQGRFLPSTLHFANYPGFFAQGVRITHNQPHDHNEFARIIHNTWQLHKNSHSLIITLLAWGAATKYTSGGEEHAMNLLNDHHGAVFHQKGRCWVIHPDHAIVKGLAWSTNSTPPDP